jgi:FG-GAP-like repeat
LLKTGWACGVCVGDYNNDGFDDLFITYWGQNILYRNNGDGTFTDVTRAAGLPESSGRWSTGCTFLDYNRDGHLDLFVASYLDFDLQKSPTPGQNANCRWMGTPVTCGPRGFLTASTVFTAIKEMGRVYPLLAGSISGCASAEILQKSSFARQHDPAFPDLALLHLQKAITLNAGNEVSWYRLSQVQGFCSDMRTAASPS